eukprot:1418412-Rhodomonas_salina.2
MSIAAAPPSLSQTPPTQSRRDTPRSRASRRSPDAERRIASSETESQVTPQCRTLSHSPTSNIALHPRRWVSHSILDTGHCITQPTLSIASLPDSERQVTPQRRTLSHSLTQNIALLSRIRA